MVDPRAQGERKPPGGPADRGPIDSAALLRGNNEVAIEHFGQVYRLRVTRTGKLILTK